METSYSYEKNWLIKWFNNHTPLSPQEIEQCSSRNYFELGWLDSLQFITFINDIEAAFEISFMNSEFQDRAFASIDGLELLIHKKKE